MHAYKYNHIVLEVMIAKRGYSAKMIKIGYESQLWFSQQKVVTQSQSHCRECNSIAMN